MVTRPPVLLQQMRSPFGKGPAAEVDRFSLNPYLDYLRATMVRPSYSSEPPPTMFSSGDLPAFIACGQPVDLLRRVAWEARHTAAMTPDAGLLFRLIEVSAGAITETLDRLVTPEGREALSAYRTRMLVWASTAPNGQQVDQMTAEQFAAQWDGAAARVEATKPITLVPDRVLSPPDRR